MSGLALCVIHRLEYHMADSTSTSDDIKHEGHTPKLESSTELRANISICCVTHLIRESWLILLPVPMIVL